MNDKLRFFWSLPFAQKWKTSALCWWKLILPWSCFVSLFCLHACIEVERGLDFEDSYQELFEAKEITNAFNGRNFFDRVLWLDSDTTLLLSYGQLIYLYNTLSNSADLRTVPNIGFIRDVKPFPDGKSIWMEAFDPTDNLLYVYTFSLTEEGASAQKLIPFPIDGRFGVVVSPKHIAYNKLRGPDFFETNDSIFLYDLESGDHQFLTSGFPISFSDDGDFLLIETADFSSYTRVNVNDQTTSAPLPIFFPFSFDIVWKQDVPTILSVEPLQVQEIIVSATDVLSNESDELLRLSDNQEAFRAISVTAAGSFALSYQRPIYNPVRTYQQSQWGNELLFYNNQTQDTTMLIKIRDSYLEFIELSPSGKKIYYQLNGRAYLQDINP